VVLLLLVILFIGYTYFYKGSAEKNEWSSLTNSDENIDPIDKINRALKEIGSCKDYCAINNNKEREGDVEKFGNNDFY
jgi:hypothetical protein